VSLWPCSFVTVATQVDLFLDAERSFTFEPLSVERSTEGFLNVLSYCHKLIEDALVLGACFLAPVDVQLGTCVVLPNGVIEAQPAHAGAGADPVVASE
jgi:hypothetical protein